MQRYAKLMRNSIFIIPTTVSGVNLCVVVVALFAWAGTTPYLQAEVEGVISQHEYTELDSNTITPYVLHEPTAETPPHQRSLLIYLYGAGGSHSNYNLKREPYAQLRIALAERGYYIVVPELGKYHFMSEKARETLDGIVKQVLAEQQIPAGRVHIMGTSMGAGSSLAYAIHRPDLIQSVCAVMPMTDFAVWVVEMPRYAPRLEASYGGTPETKPKAYEMNSAVKNPDAFANIPIMLIHGNEDTIVRDEHSIKLADLLQKNGYACTFHSVNGLGHTDQVMTDYQIETADFFDAAME